MKKIFNICLVATCFVFSCKTTGKASNVYSNLQAYDYNVQKSVIAANGAVVSAHPLASKVGLEILKQGGNAIDAAIATQLALAVVYPQAGNIGGGGFMVARLSNGQIVTLDYRETAPGKAFRDMYIDPDGKARTDKSQDGHLSCGVPGTIAGLFEASKYGKLPFNKLIEPAIELAEKGYRIRKREANGLTNLQKDLKQFNSVMPVFVKESGWNEDDSLIQTDLANTLKRIKDKGAAGFYEGETAKLIVEEMQRGHGLISYEDLKNYKAKSREPQQFTYKDYKIIGMGMPSSGGVIINQLMKMVENRKIGEMGFQSPQAVQLMVEAERRAYADRAEHMGDADFYKVPVKAITDSNYIVNRMKDYQSNQAGNSADIKPGIAGLYESEETTHLSVIDKDGNAVSVTTTLNNSYGSRTVVGGAGFFLNDEMDDFSIKPGVPTTR